MGKNINWVCRICWASGAATTRHFAEKQHEDMANDKTGYQLRVDKKHAPDIILRDELPKVEFEGLAGERRLLDLDASEPLEIR